jgi:hypothetical protein
LLYRYTIFHSKKHFFVKANKAEKVKIKIFCCKQ